MRKGFLLFSLSVLLFACNNGSSDDAYQNNSSIPKSKSDSIYKSIMDGHDLAMKKMGTIARYTSLIKQYQDSLNKTGSKDILMTAALDSALQGLTAADEAMNKWMVEFDPDKAGTEEPAKLQFFTTEMEKITAVELRMDSSIALAQKITGR